MEKTVTQSEILKGAMIGGSINALINGLITWFKVKDQGQILLTNDVISSNNPTVFSGVVTTALSLAFVLTTVAYFTWKMPNKPSYFPRVFFMAIKHAIFTFGLVVALAILVQYYAGSIEVSPVFAAVLTALIAAFTAGTVTYMTHMELLKDHP